MFGNCVKISLEVAICNGKADSLSYSQGIDNVFVVVEKKKFRFSYYFYWLLEVDGVIYVCRWNFVAMGIWQCAIETKFKCEIIVIDNNYSLGIHWSYALSHEGAAASVCIIENGGLLW